MFLVDYDHAGGLTDPMYDDAGNLLGGADQHDAYGEPCDEPATGGGLLSAIRRNPLVVAAMAGLAWAMGMARH